MNAANVEQEVTLSTEARRVTEGLLDGSPDAELNARAYLDSALRPLFSDVQRRREKVETFLEKIKADRTAEQEATPALVLESSFVEPVVVVPPASQTFFESIALPLASRGWDVAPCYPNDKQVHTKLVPSPLTMKSRDPAQIRAWGAAEPFANVCVYAEQKPGGLLFLDKDGAVSLRGKYEQETGNKFPGTLLVRSSIVSDGSGGTITKGHWYFYQTSKTIALGKNISETNTGGLFSLRVKNAYVTSIGSTHPDTGKPYEVAEDYPVLPMDDSLLDWLLKQVVDKPRSREEVAKRGKYTKGTRYTALMSELGHLWNRGYDKEGLLAAGLAWARANFDTGAEEFNDALVQKEIEHYAKSYGDGESAHLVLNQGRLEPLTVPEGVVPIAQETDTSPIPPFDLSVVNGIYKKFVDVATRGTTMTPQFVYAIAKTVVGARMAGKVKFENLDVEPRFYTALIGETGSGKGEAWRRVLQILNCEGQIGDASKLEIINSADSGAGIRDAFFANDKPLLLYVDEVESFGNKAAATRNPAIMDVFIELADSTSISSVKASRGKAKGTKTKNDARLCAVLCGQDGHVYMKAFAGRTKLGLWDRLTPEYGVAVEAGDLPHISMRDAFQLLNELNKLDYSGMMTMLDDAKARLESFWSEQPTAVRKKVRWKKNLTLDAYISAFGRGVKIVEMGDVEIAVKIFTRQLVIRQTHFTSEVPDRIGYYLGLVKAITEKMQRQLAAGLSEWQVAKSRRDYERESHAHRDNETHIFERAWAVHAPTWLTKVEVKKPNGQTYVKYLPVWEDD